jgi:hypothetical protein
MDYVDRAECAGSHQDGAVMSPIWLIAVCIGVASAVAAWVHLFRVLTVQRGAERKLGERTATVDRLLEFSQTIQGAGKSDQIFATLNHFLRKELNLSGIAILTSEADAQPSIQLRTAWPKEIAAPVP